MILVTVLVIVHGFTAIITRINILDNITSSISDLDITDIYFTNGFSFKDENVDRDIVIVNIGELDRAGIARQLEVVNKYNPKVVAMNAIFPSKSTKEPWKDSLLISAFESTKDLVFTSGYEEETHPDFIPSKARVGLGEFQQEDNVVRHFYKGTLKEGEVVMPFAFEIAHLYDTTLASRYFERGNTEEYIYFTGYMQDPYGFRPNLGKSENIFLNSLMSESNRNNTRFYALDWQEVVDESFDPEIIDGKIVLLGYLGSDFKNMRIDDRFWTPIHPELMRRSVPLMYGAEVHANIISMLINNEMIYHNKTLNLSVLIFILVLFTIYFDWLFRRFNRRYQLYSKSSMVVFINLLIFLNLLVFHYFRIKIDVDILFIYLLVLPDTIEILGSMNAFTLLRSKFEKRGKMEEVATP